MARMTSVLRWTLTFGGRIEIDEGDDTAFINITGHLDEAFLRELIEAATEVADHLADIAADNAEAKTK